MNYAIIAAGEGSRLASEGFSLPKPMAQLHGEMLIDRLIRVFVANGAESIRIIVNESSPLLEAHLKQLADSAPIHIVRNTTPSSLHSFHELVTAFGDDQPLCLTTTDTVFYEEEFSAYIDAFKGDLAADGLMAVTGFIDDESPLYVDTDDNMTVNAFLDKPNGHARFVSGGIYCLNPKALKTVADTIASGTSRMRNFQRQLLTNKLNIKSFEFSKIVDVDHVRDIQTAERFLEEAPSFPGI